jgi:peroxiredoxin
VTTVATPAGRSCRRRAARLASAILGSVLCASIAQTGNAGADSTRFIPWKDATTPALTLKDLAGSEHTLAGYQGRAVLLNFWATWCEPCRAEMASMRTLQERLSGRPFAVLLVNYGEAKARVGDFVKREAIAFPILLDPNQDAPRAWRVRLLPTSFLIAPDGRVRYSVIGEIDWAQTDAVQLVQSLLR